MNEANTRGKCGTGTSTESWAKRTWAALIAVIVLSLVAVGYAFYRVEAQRVRLDQYNELAAIGALKVGQIVHWRRELLNSAYNTAESPYFRRGVDAWLKDTGNLALRDELIQRLKLEHWTEDHADALFLEPDGRILLAVRDDPDPLDAATMKAVTEALASKQAVISDFFRCPDGEVYIDVVAPVSDANNEIIAFVVLRSNTVKFLYPLIQSWPIPSRSAETFLVQKEGDDVLFLNELRHQAGAALSLRFPMTRSDLPAVQAVAGRQGMFEGSDYRGVVVLADLRPIPGSPWFMVAKVDRSESLAEARYRGVVIAVFVVLFILLAFVVVGFTYRQRQAHLYRKLYREEREKHKAQEALRVSEERHRTILQTAMDGFWLMDTQGRLLEVNERYCRMSGYSARELLTMGISDLDACETEDDTAAHIQKVMGQGENRFETRHRRKDGSVLDVEISAQYRPAEGECFVVFLRDITERKRAEGALRESETHYRGLFEHMGEGCAYCEMIFENGEPRDFIYLAVNAAFETLTGLRNVVGKKVSEVIPGIREADPQLFAIYARVSLTGKPEKFEMFVEAMKMWFSISVYSPEKGCFVAVFDVITERKRAEEELRHSKHSLAEAERIGNTGSWNYDVASDTAVWSENMFRIFDVDPAMPRELVFKHFVENLVHPDDRTHIFSVFQEALIGKRPYDLEYRVVGRNGSVRNIHALAEVLRDEHGKPIRMMGRVEDITERKRAEAERDKMQAQLNQAQKMESVGRLAGGVAHDFNNMLGVILGHTEMALEQVDPAQPIHADLTEIGKAAERSADLTRQLLAFARKQTVAPKVLDLNEAVGGMLKMLRRLIGEDIDLVWLPGAGLGPVKVDPSQIDQILTNLCVNARDAIADVGKITIETENSSFDEEYCATHAGFVSGEYVRLVVSDDGCGMEKETLAHIFEPFFTTKGMGKGTGLGLATVYGAVKQNNGFINAYSEPGQGTTFTIYLPRHVGKSEQLRTKGPVEAAGHSDATVLLVEDEPSILNMCGTMLEKLGYKVLTASTPGEAIRLAETHLGEIHLLMTDVVMPEMNGRDLAKNLLSLYPQLKRLFMSGYTADVIAHHGVLDEGVYFIQKPFSINGLAAKVLEALSDE